MEICKTYNLNAFDAIERERIKMDGLFQITYLIQVHTM